MAVEPLYTLEQLAEKTGRSVSSWRRDIRAGVLAAQQSTAGGGIRVSESAFDDWLLATRIDPGQPLPIPSSPRVPAKRCFATFRP